MLRASASVLPVTLGTVTRPLATLRLTEEFAGTEPAPGRVDTIRPLAMSGLSSTTVTSPTSRSSPVMTDRA